MLALPVLTVPGVASAGDEVSAGDTVVGEFTQVWPEYEDSDEAAEHANDGPLSYVRTDDGASVRVDTEDVEQVEVGATVELTVGREVSDAASEELGYAEAREVLGTEVLGQAEPVAPGTATASPPFTNSVTVAMVVPAGGTQDATTLADVVTQVNGPVADFWEVETDGAIKIGVTAQHDWFTTTASCLDPFALWEEAAARVNFVEGPGKHLLLYVTSTPATLAGCSYGLAEVGLTKTSGGFAYVRAAATPVIAHELGHNFGLSHSSASQCDMRVNFGGCNIRPYFDLYDVMGFSWDQLGSLNVVQTSRLVPIQVQSFDLGAPTATVTIAPVSQRAGIRAAVLKTSHPSAHYWLEYRPAAGRDAWLGTAANWPKLQPGVLLRRDESLSGSSDASLLLDGTPSPRAGWDADVSTALPVGTPIHIKDTYGLNGGFTVTVTSVSATGATVEISPLTAMNLAYEESGGSSGPLGLPTAAEACGYLDVIPYCQRSYQNGEILWRSDGGGPAFTVHGGLHTAWVAAGGLGKWGLPTSNTTCGLSAGGCAQSFANAAGVYWSSGTGLRETSGGIRGYYVERRGPAGWLGYPNGDLTCYAARCWQSFQGAEVTWSPSSGVRMTQGGIRGTWAAMGGGAGALGAAATDMACGLTRGGCGQHFEGGSVFWSPASGSHAMFGAIRDAWGAQLGELGSLGYPIGGMSCALSCIQYFQGGAIVWSPFTGALPVSGAIYGRWQADAAMAGPLGIPTGPTFCGLIRGGCGQNFQHGSIYWSPASGAQPVSGAIRAAWIRQGGQNGRLGYPTSAVSCFPGTCRSFFQRGEITWTVRTGTRTRYY